MEQVARCVQKAGRGKMKQQQGQDLITNGNVLYAPARLGEKLISKDIFDANMA